MNDLFSFSFTDRYRRDGLAGVRVPRLNPDIWKYAIEDAGGGAMLWRDDNDELVAFNLAHHSGVEGWMGPLAVRPDSQGQGIGKMIVSTAIAWLKGAGATTIGLETMPRTVENIGFYGGLGFEPGYLTMSLARELEVAPAHECRLMSDQSPPDREEFLRSITARVQRSFPRVDFEREHVLTHSLGIGDTVVLDGDDGVVAACLFHSAPLAANRHSDEVRVLKAFARSVGDFERLIETVEFLSLQMGLTQISVRAQSQQAGALRILLGRGYRVRWTDLRMTLRGFPEQPVPAGEVMFSNWEI